MPNHSDIKSMMLLIDYNINSSFRNPIVVLLDLVHILFICNIISHVFIDVLYVGACGVCASACIRVDG